MRKNLILISSKAITVNTFLDQQIIDLKNNFKLQVCVGDPENIKIKCNKSKINFPKNFYSLINIFLIIKCLYQIRVIINSIENTEIFVHTPLAAHLVRLALIFSKKKIIYFVHGFRFHKKTNFFFYIFYSSIEILLKYKTKYYFVINKEDKQFVKKILKKKFYFINGIGINLKKKYKKNNNKEVLKIGVISAYRKNKGYNDLFSIIQNLKNKNIFFECFGYGSKNLYKKKIREMGLEKKIKLNSFKNNIEKYISTFDLLLHPSFREGLPISIIQALYQQVPVIGRDIRGVNDLIKDKKYGYLIKNDFVKKSIIYIKFLNNNKYVLKKMEKNILEMNFKKFSKKLISLKITKLLKLNCEI